MYIGAVCYYDLALSCVGSFKPVDAAHRGVDVGEEEGWRPQYLPVGAMQFHTDNIGRGGVVKMDAVANAEKSVYPKVDMTTFHH